MLKADSQKQEFLQFFSCKISNLFFLIVILILLNSCGKTKKYLNNQTYDIHVDTATLVVKITNTEYLPVDVATQPTRLLLFDSKNLYTRQIPSNGITTKDTSITINGIGMGHYTALLIVDVPGMANLNYLKEGKQSYQNVMDTLQYLLTDTYVASTQNIIVNNKVNEGNINIQPLVSLVSQVSFDLSSLLSNDVWQNPHTEKYTLYFLVFQNNTLVMSRPVKDEDMKNGVYQIPIAKGANYSFMFTDLVNESTSPANIDSMINGKTTPTLVQQKLEDNIDGIRMGNVSSGNLTKTEQTYKVTNSIASIPIVLSGTTTPKQWSNPTDCEGWNLLIFGQSGYLKKGIVQPNSPITSNPSPKDALVVKVFAGAKYTFLAIGNAENAVGYYQQQNTLSPITSSYILNGTDNLQKRQDYLYSWIAVDSGIMSSRLINGQFKMIPDIRLNFNKMQEMTIADVRKQTGNYFKDNPRKITGIVTSIGKVITGIDENPMPNLVVLQDGQNAAIPIQFENVPKDLNRGDQITIALQDGSITTSNVNANNILVLENVTYTEVSKSEGVGVPVAKELTLAQAKEAATYAKYESMLVTIKDLEFRWFKDLQYLSLGADSMILRDANTTTAPPSKLPTERNTINMVVSKKATVQFANTLIPVGKCTITGFLTKTGTGNKYTALMPQTSKDVICPTNTLATRVDKGVVVNWIAGSLTTNSNLVPNGVQPLGTYAEAGVAREGSYVTGNSAMGNSGQNGSVGVYVSTTGGSAGAASPGIYMHFIRGSWTVDGITKAIIIYVDTKEMAPGEDLQLVAFNGERGSSTLINEASMLVFDVTYSVNGKNITGVPLTLLNMDWGTKIALNSGLPMTIPGVGGSNLIITLTYKSGNVGKFNANDNWASFTNIKLSQIEK